MSQAIHVLRFAFARGTVHDAERRARGASSHQNVRLRQRSHVVPTSVSIPHLLSRHVVRTNDRSRSMHGKQMPERRYDENCSRAKDNIISIRPPGHSCVSFNRTVAFDSPNGPRTVEVIDSCACQKSCYRASHYDVFRETRRNETTGEIIASTKASRNRLRSLSL